MNKQELIEATQAKVIANYLPGLSKKAVESTFAALTDIVIETLKKDGELTLPGLGKLYVTQRSARKGRNPKTSEPIDIEAKRVPKFSASKSLKEAVA